MLFASSGQTRKKDGQPHISPIWPCSGCGLPSQPVARLPVSSCLAFSPLPGYKILIKTTWRYIFCCTCAGIRFTSYSAGSYPASCPAELGLSSKTICIAPATTQLTPIIIITKITSFAVYFTAILHLLFRYIVKK